MLHKQDVFEARTKGYKTYRVPGIAVTKNGVVLVTTEARPGKGGDWSFNDIQMRRSTDGGGTFGETIKIVDHADYGDGPVSNFVLIPDMQTGRVIAVFCHDYARVFTMRSDDDGATFTAPVEITPTFKAFRKDYPWEVCATGPGHGLQLRNGRMVVPVWLSDGSGTEFGHGKKGHRPSVVTSIVSDDGGATWHAGDILCRHDDVVEDCTVVNPSETIAVELSDGRVMFNIRTESVRNRRLIAISPDGATNWYCRGFDEALIEPVCMGSIVRYDWPDGDKPGHILFANPSTLEEEMRKNKGKVHCDRKNVTVRVSTDDAATWPVSRVLEPGPSGYSDLAVLADGTILCVYECDIVERIHDDRYVRVARFDMDWLGTGK